MARDSSGWEKTPTDQGSLDSYTFTGSQEQEGCGYLHCLLLPPASLVGASELGRREKGKVSGFKDQRGKGERREKHGRGEEKETEERREDVLGYR